MGKLVRLSVVVENGKRDAAKKTRSVLFQCARGAAEEHGGDIAGFALVTWNREGIVRSAFNTPPWSPIGIRLVPAVVHDALQQQVAVHLTDAGFRTTFEPDAS